MNEGAGKNRIFDKLDGISETKVLGLDAQDQPAEPGGFVVFLKVTHNADGTPVRSARPDAALDLQRDFVGRPSEIEPPAADRMKLVLLLEAVQALRVKIRNHDGRRVFHLETAISERTAPIVGAGVVMLANRPSRLGLPALRESEKSLTALLIVLISG